MAKKSLADQFRDGIRASGISLYRISKETGVERAVLSKFMHEHVGINLTTANKLCSFFNWSLDTTKTKRGGTER